MDTLLIAVLNSAEIASALEEAGISAKQMAASVEELRGSSAKVLLGYLMPFVAYPAFLKSRTPAVVLVVGHGSCWPLQPYTRVSRLPVLLLLVYTHARLGSVCCAQGWVSLGVRRWTRRRGTSSSRRWPSTRWTSPPRPPCWTR